ncbi:MAG: macro domain-containing protein, partial [bacterium]|nr:macro domain-containing protein [bacterium]
NLFAKYIIHTVGPDYGYEKGRESELLQSCYVNSLKLAKEYGIRTIAFPAISVGVYHYPFHEATKIAVETVKEFVKRESEAFDEIRFVAFSDEVYEVYSGMIPLGLKSIGDIIKEMDHI